MKRVGYLKERMLTEENFIKAEKLMAKNKPDNKMAKHLARHAEKYGKILLDKIKAGEFEWHEPRESVIKDSYKGKTRYLRIPCLEDQAAQIAWLNIAIPYIEKRNYYYNCGSIPKAGQTRCTKGLQKWLRNKKAKYGAIADIRKFYDTCPHSIIRKGLTRIFKDKWFVDFIMWMLRVMSPSGIGLAIGFPSSHWLANVALMELDHRLKRKFPKIKMTRYMDDIAMTSTNYRMIKKALYFLKEQIEQLGMRLKKWAVFNIQDRGLKFLSYRVYNRYTIMVKPLMIRIARRMKKAGVKLNAHIASGIISYFGILEYCNSYNFRMNNVYPYIDKRVCINLIRARSMMA